MKEVQVAAVLRNSTISRFGDGKYSMIKQVLVSRVTPSGFLVTLVKAFASNALMEEDDKSQPRRQGDDLSLWSSGDERRTDRR